MKIIETTTDPQARASYYRVRNGEVTQTLSVPGDRVWLDVDDDGRLLGIEALW